jgi:hypothetical protein
MTTVGIQMPEDRLGKDEYVKLPDYEKEHYLKNLIKRIVEVNYPNGVTAKQIREALEIDPRILDKHLTSMEHTGEIYTFKYDRTTVYFPLYQLRNRLGDFVYIQEMKKKGYTEEVDKGIQIPVDKFPEFVEYLKECLSEMLRRK